jgi:cobalamin biosynthesis Mg chelatase CobN
VFRLPQGCSAESSAFKLPSYVNGESTFEANARFQDYLGQINEVPNIWNLSKVIVEKLKGDQYQNINLSELGPISNMHLSELEVLLRQAKVETFKVEKAAHTGSSNRNTIIFVIIVGLIFMVVLMVALAVFLLKLHLNKYAYPI